METPANQVRPETFVRALHLLGKSGTDQYEKIKEQLPKTAKTLGTLPSMGVTTIASAMAAQVADQFPMFPAEFKSMIGELGIIGNLLIDPFIASIKKEDPNEQDEDSAQKTLARSELGAFLTEGLSAHPHTTMNTFLHGLRQHYPTVRLGELLQEKSFRSQFTREVETTFYQTAESILLARIQESNTILNYFFSRIVTLTADSYEINTPRLEELIKALDGIGYRLEDLYDLLEHEFDEIKKMASGPVDSVRSAVAKRVAFAAEGANMGKLENIAFDEDAQRGGRKTEFDRLFRRHIVPTIKKVRASKLPQKPRLVDLWLMCKVLSHYILPDKALEPIKKLVELKDRDPEGFQKFLRHYFNYNGWPGIDITDEQIEALLSCQLEKGFKEHLSDYSVPRALVQKDCENRAHVVFQLWPPFRQCRDIRKLFEYAASPKTFYRDFPGYVPEIMDSDSTPVNARFREDSDPLMQEVSLDFIQHQALIALQLLLQWRQESFADSTDPEVREDLEAHLKQNLDITIEQETEIEFRLELEVLPDKTPEETLSLYDQGKYDGEKGIIVNDEKYKTYYGNNSGLIKCKPDLLKCEPGDYIHYTNPEDGKQYILFPYEKKKIVEGSCNPPAIDGKRNGAHKILIYYAQEHMVDEKTPQAGMSTRRRRKAKIDQYRSTIIPQTEAGLEALTDACYNNYSSSEPEQIRDNREGEERTVEKAGKIKNKATKLGKERPYSASLYAVKPKVTDDHGNVVDDNGNLINKKGEIIGSVTKKYRKYYRHQKIPFELQMHYLPSILFQISRYGHTSHSNDYTVKREYDSARSQIYPPYYVGPVDLHYKDVVPKKIVYLDIN